jgi:hypothetical protein
MCTFVRRLDVPDDALDDPPVLEAAELGLVAPEVAEALGDSRVRLVCRRAVIDET